MAATNTAILQTVWDCRFSRPGYRLTGVSEQFQPEPFWICVRRGDRRGVSEEECAACPHWEVELPKN